MSFKGRNFKVILNGILIQGLVVGVLLGEGGGASSCAPMLDWLDKYWFALCMDSTKEDKTWLVSEMDTSFGLSYHQIGQNHYGFPSQSKSEELPKWWGLRKKRLFGFWTIWRRLRRWTCFWDLIANLEERLECAFRGEDETPNGRFCESQFMKSRKKLLMIIFSLLWVKGNILKKKLQKGAPKYIGSI